MISVDQALARIFDLVKPLDEEFVSLNKAAGRVLARPVGAARNQPPFSSSAMDGYAICNTQVAVGDRFSVIGEAAAGHGFDGQPGPNEAVRIFTGAPVPTNAKRVIIQEDVTRSGAQITVAQSPGNALFIRAAASDFKIGDTLPAPRRLSSADVALLAAMNIDRVPVTRRPVVALIATGDELVMPGEVPGDDQIIASNCFGLAAMVETTGGIARILPIARDSVGSLTTAFELARDADMIVTVGGASVGDHDLVGVVAADLGMKQAFYKVAMRPGKPLMAGEMGGSVMLGLPGNPVSSMVCGTIFMLPALRVMQGLAHKAAPRHKARLTRALPPGGPREHYMRAHVQDGEIFAYDKQDSSLLSVLSEANALLVRPVNDPARAVGVDVDHILL